MNSAKDHRPTNIKTRSRRCHKMEIKFTLFTDHDSVSVSAIDFEWKLFPFNRNSKDIDLTIYIKSLAWLKHWYWSNTSLESFFYWFVICRSFFKNGFLFTSLHSFNRIWVKTRWSWTGDQSINWPLLSVAMRRRRKETKWSAQLVIWSHKDRTPYWHRIASHRRETSEEWVSTTTTLMF